MACALKLPFKNETPDCCKSGKLMSASPARQFPAQNIVANTMATPEKYFFNPIIQNKGRISCPMPRKFSSILLENSIARRKTNGACSRVSNSSRYEFLWNFYDALLF
jgi:hypothetical protein